MKKGRPKKKPPRFSTRILLAALAAALAINGYFAWQILGKPLQTEQTQTAAGTVPAEVQERLWPATPEKIKPAIRDYLLREQASTLENYIDNYDSLLQKLR